MATRKCSGIAGLVIGAVLTWCCGFAGALAAPQLPVLDVVVGNNFGHLPMYIGVEKGFFKQYGVEVRLKIPEQFATSFMADVQKTNPEYFSDLPPLPAGR